MSVSGSRKEFILNLILKQNPFLISQFIGGEYRHIELELYRKKMYFDMYGREIKSNLPVYVETQLSKADPIHYEKVRKTIESIEEGIVLWIATDFTEEYIDGMYNLLHFKMAKPINLYMVKLSNNYQYQLDILNKGGQVELWNKIVDQKINLPILSLFQAIEIVPSDYQSKFEEHLGESLTTVKGANKYFLRCLKERIPFFLNAHRSKANPKKRQIVFGAGKAGLDYVVCLQDKDKQCYFKLRLTNERHKDLYNKIQWNIEKEVKYCHLVIGDNQIVFSYPETYDVLKRITSIIDHFERVILLVDPIVNQTNKLI